MTVSATYAPRPGRALTMIEHARREPARIFTTAECAEIMGCKRAAVGSTIEYAIRACAIYKRYTDKGGCEYSASPMDGAVVPAPAKPRTKHPERASTLAAGWATDPDDPRIGKVVPGWRPPVMQCVRG